MRGEKRGKKSKEATNKELNEKQTMNTTKLDQSRRREQELKRIMKHKQKTNDTKKNVHYTNKRIKDMP